MKKTYKENLSNKKLMSIVFFTFSLISLFLPTNITASESTKYQISYIGPYELKPDGSALLQIRSQLIACLEEHIKQEKLAPPTDFVDMRITFDKTGNVLKSTYMGNLTLDSVKKYTSSLISQLSHCPINDPTISRPIKNKTAAFYRLYARIDKGVNIQDTDKIRNYVGEIIQLIRTKSYLLKNNCISSDLPIISLILDSSGKIISITYGKKSRLEGCNKSVTKLINSLEPFPMPPVPIEKGHKNGEVHFEVDFHNSLLY